MIVRLHWNKSAEISGYCTYIISSVYNATYKAIWFVLTGQPTRVEMFSHEKKILQDLMLTKCFL